MALGTLSGSARYTADQALGGSGKTVRVFNATFLNAASAGTLVLRNGTTASGDIWVQSIGTGASRTDTLNWEEGLVFTNGLFFDKDTNVTAVVLTYRIEV